MTVPTLIPLRAVVETAKIRSRLSATAAAITVATTYDVNLLSPDFGAWVAARPAIAPVMERLAVYVSHRRRGGFRASSDSDAAETNIDANGPNITAAKRVGTREIDCSSVLVRRTRPASAMAATSASAITG
jgi:hypothetical protein